MVLAFTQLMESSRPIILLAMLGLLAGCSHDAQRENPLDPELTPAVILSVSLDDTTATALLSWTPYEGPFDFAAGSVPGDFSGSIAADA